MARRRKKKWLMDLGKPRLPDLPEIEIDQSTKKAIFIVFLFVLGLISVLSLFNAAGALGQYLLRAMELAVGWGKYILPLVILVIGYFMYHEDKYELKNANYLGLIIFFFTFESMLQVAAGSERWAIAPDLGIGGGYIGQFILSALVGLMGFWASFILLLGLLIVSLMIMFDTTLIGLFGPDSWFAKLMTPINWLLGKIFNRREEEDEDEEEEEEEEENEDEEEEEKPKRGRKKKEAEEEDEEEENDEEEDEDNDEDEGGENEDEDEPAARKREPEFVMAKKANGKQEIETWWSKPTGIEVDLSLDLLSGKKSKATSGDIKNNTEIIEHTLEKFGIPVEMGEVSVGPTVTQYTFKPAEGIKLSRITTLSNDLALSLASHPIRIEAPIPGKSLVGVEVPNQIKAMVGLKEILTNKDYDERKSDSMIALGKDVSGKVWLSDITKMPHLLVAGATNSGKSVCLNAIILSLMYQNNPDDLRFIMVDPKRVELTLYNGIPYLLTPVITDVPKTINALKWCMNEMDQRFDLLSQKGKRNIQSYNETAKVKMPYVIFIIDELADLMVAASKEVEGSIIRLAQMARAVGIHLILATQRPSVDVITGIIKANMPARIAFSVASGIDSRTILDTLGAEKLLGRGDMLFTTAELSKPKRLQGAYVSELEIKKIVRQIKEAGGHAEYVEGITEKQKVRGLAGFGLNGDSGVDGDEDELLGEAKELIINSGKASASFLQRRLSVGYARAARLLDLLEQMGVVGPSNGAKPREIMITKEQYEAMSDMGVSGMSLHNRDEAEVPEEFLETEEEDDDEGDSKDEEENDEDEDNEEDDENQDEDDEDKEENDEENQEESDDEDDEDQEEEKEVKNKKPSNKKSKELSEDEGVERLLEEGDPNQPKKDKPVLDKFFSR